MAVGQLLGASAVCYLLQLRVQEPWQAGSQVCTERKGFME
jgi:hypothetical protein